MITLRIAFPLLGVVCFACCSAPARAQSNERGLWTLWKRHLESPDGHDELAAACAAFEKAAPQDPLGVVSRGLAAWHLLKAGRHEAAKARWLPTLADRSTPLKAAASDNARHWLTRLDREDVRRALQEVYLRDVAYPETLEALRTLPEDRRVPAQDRWGRPWDYQLVGFKKLAGLPGQRYELRSPLLGAASDLNAALDTPYASRIPLKASRLLPGTGGSETVEFIAETENPGGPLLMKVGARSGRIVFAHLGQNLIILSDGDHWKVLPKPRP